MIEGKSVTIIGIIIISIAFLIFIFTLIFAKLREHIKLILPITIAFGFLGFGLMIYDRVTELTLPGGVSIKTIVQKTLERAESVEQIERIVLAQGETIGLVAKNANELQPELLRVSDEVKKFEHFINDMKDNLQKQYQTFSDELSRIKLQNSLPTLGDNAISEGSRDSFVEIIHVAEAAGENNSLKRAAIEQIKRIKDNYSKQSSFIGPSLTVTLDDGAIKEDS